VKNPSSFVGIDEVLEQRPISAERMNKARAEGAAYEFGFQLKEVRRRSGLSQAQVAEKLGVSQNRVSQIERGQIEKTQIGTLMSYIEALGGLLTVSARHDAADIVLVQSAPLERSPVTWSELVNSKG
jgi:predicted XRE-type DNA-binding protein